MGRACSKHAYKISAVKPERKRPLRKARNRWDNNIRMALWERVRSRVLDASGSGQGSVAGSCEHGNEPSGSITGGDFLD
jgi:hypothetical protein